MSSPPSEKFAKTRAALFGERGAAEDASLTRSGSKVSVVGCGAVGMAVAFSVMNQGLCSELALVDMNEDKLEGERLDLMHGRAFIKHVRIWCVQSASRALRRPR